MPSWSQSSNHPPQHPHLLFTSLTLLITPQPTHHITNHIPYPPHQQPHLLPPSPLPSHQQHPLLTLPPTSPTHPLANHITYPPPRQPHPINHIPCPSHQQPHTLPTLLPTTSPIQPTTRLTNPSTYPPHQHMQALSWALGQRLTFKPGPRQTGQGVQPQDKRGMTYIQTWTWTNWAGSSAPRQERDDLHSNLDPDKLGREFNLKTREGWLTFKPGPEQTGQGVQP